MITQIFVCCSACQAEHTKMSDLVRPNRPKRRKHGYSPDQSGQNVCVGQTKEINIWVLARKKQTELWVLAGLIRQKCGCSIDRTDQNLCIDQTEHTKMSGLVRPKRPECGFWPYRTDQNGDTGTKNSVCLVWLTPLFQSVQSSQNIIWSVQ